MGEKKENIDVLPLFNISSSILESELVVPKLVWKQLDWKMAPSPFNIVTMTYFIVSSLASCIICGSGGGGAHNVLTFK